MNRYRCHWETKIAPGCTYYSGTVETGAENEEHAAHIARRLVEVRSCFSPGTVRVTSIEHLSNTESDS